MSRDYSNPVPTVDVIIESAELPGSVLLIRRRNPPLGWALPGGFVDEGESVANAALRETAEETGLSIELDEQFFTYSDPGRDPRRHTISVVFLARTHEEPLASDDAVDARFFDQETLPPLVFDHLQILEDYFLYKRTGRRPPPTR